MTEFCRILWEVDLQRTVWALPFPMTGRSSVVLGLCNEKPESLSLKYGGEETLTCTGQVKRRSTKVQSCVGCHAMWRNVYRVTVIRSIYLPLTFEDVCNYHDGDSAAIACECSRLSSFPAATGRETESGTMRGGCIRTGGTLQMFGSGYAAGTLTPF